MSAYRHIAIGVLTLLLVGCGGYHYAPVYDGTSEAPGHYREHDGRYVVRAGDTLYSIAWHNGLDFRDVARWNGIRSPYLIHPGEVVRLTPPPRARSARQAPRSVPVHASPAHEKPARARGGEVVLSHIRWQWPTVGTVAKPFDPNGLGKKGIDIAGRLDQPIVAAAAGRVVYSGSGLVGYGRLIIVKHDARYLTAYGYNAKLLVKEGDTVNRGQTIALMGMGPGNRPMLHFELRRDGKPVNPARYLPTQ